MDAGEAKSRVKKKEPSLRARKYVKNVVAGMTDYQAAIDAGYSSKTAIKANAQIVEKSRGVKELLIELMERKGLTDDHLLDKLSDGLDNATKIQGTQDDFVEVPDYAVRHKYLETGLKLKGYTLNQETKEINIDARTQILNSFNAVEPDEVKQFLKWRDEQRTKSLSKSQDSSPEGISNRVALPEQDSK